MCIHGGDRLHSPEMATVGGAGSGGHDPPEDRCLEAAVGNQEVSCAGSFSEAREGGAGQEGAQEEKEEEAERLEKREAKA